uniref:Uncharacterized protein n=1 Tax=Rhizophora mucronata TaxID=61149 RepID=A0A2P2NKS2_RHIMU
MNGSPQTKITSAQLFLSKTPRTHLTVKRLLCMCPLQQISN